MNRWRRLELGAALAILLAAGVAASVLVGLAGPATERGPLGRSSADPAVLPTAPEVLASAPVSAQHKDKVPRYPSVTRTAAQLRGGGADLYLPSAASAGRAQRRFPIAVLVADPRIDTGQYEQLAHDLGTYGIAVVVSGRAAGPAVREVDAWASAVTADSTEYLADKVARSVAFVVLAGEARAPTGIGGNHPTVTVGRSDPLSVTDEGSRGARSSNVVSPARLRTIAESARPAALWLLAHKGDSGARRSVEARRAAL